MNNPDVLIKIIFYYDSTSETLMEVIITDACLILLLLILLPCYNINWLLYFQKCENTVSVLMLLWSQKSIMLCVIWIIYFI